MTINEFRQLMRSTFPQCNIVYATDGTRTLGDEAYDNPQPIPYSTAPDRPQDRARQAALRAMRVSVAGQERKPP
jgi:hypothetical protein